MSPFAQSLEECVLFCGCRWSRDGLCWRATRSRISRPELICGRWDGAWSSRRVLLPGPGADRREAARSRPGVWFWLWNHIGPDRFRHAWKTHTGRLSMVRRRCGKGVAGKGSSQILQNEKEIPRLTGRSCGEFPGI